MGEKSHENNLIYGVSYKHLIGTKPLCIMFDKVNGFIRDYDGTKCLVLFAPEKYDAIFDRIRYLIGLKSGIAYVGSFDYPKIKTGSDDDLPLEKTLTMHNNVIIVNHYYYKTFLEKCSYKSGKK